MPRNFLEARKQIVANHHFVTQHHVSRNTDLKFCRMLSVTYDVNEVVIRRVSGDNRDARPHRHRQAATDALNFKSNIVISRSTLFCDCMKSCLYTYNTTVHHLANDIISFLQPMFYAIFE